MHICGISTSKSMIVDILFDDFMIKVFEVYEPIGWITVGGRN
jgi:hypothetical protein